MQFKERHKNTEFKNSREERAFPKCNQLCNLLWIKFKNSLFMYIVYIC